MNEVNNISNININSLIDSIIHCTYNRITLSADDYQELVAKAADQDRAVNKENVNTNGERFRDNKTT